MSWSVRIARPAQRSLEKLPENYQRLIQKALHQMENDPFSGDVRKLSPSGFRRRVGPYRIFFDLYSKDRALVITAITRRTSKTY